MDLVIRILKAIGVLVAIIVISGLITLILFKLATAYPQTMSIMAIVAMVIFIIWVFAATID